MLLLVSHRAAPDSFGSPSIQAEFWDVSELGLSIFRPSHASTDTDRIPSEPAKPGVIMSDSKRSPAINDVPGMGNRGDRENVGMGSDDAEKMLWGGSGAEDEEAVRLRQIEKRNAAAIASLRRRKSW